MELENIRTYYLILEESIPNIKSKVRFSKFIKVNEFSPITRETSLINQKYQEMKKIAKKFETIDGGLRPTSNKYRAVLELNGFLTDLYTRKTMTIPKDKLDQIKLCLPIQNTRSKVMIKINKATRSINIKYPVRLPSLIQLKKR